MGNFDTGQDLRDIITANFNTLDAADVEIVLDMQRWEEHFQKTAADAMAATATAQFVIGGARRRARVKAVYYATDAALVSSDTNFATLIVQKLTAAGASPVTVASVTTAATAPGSGTWVAQTLIPIPLSVVAGANVLESLAALTFGITKTGAGVVVPAGKLIVVLEPAGASDSTT